MSDRGAFDRGTSTYEKGTSKAPYYAAAGPDAGPPSLPAGVWDPYDLSDRVIVPDELSDKMNRYQQMIESEFLDNVSRTLFDRLRAAGRDSGQSARRIYDMLVEGRTIAIGPSQVWNPIDPWLGERLGLGPGSSPGDYEERILELATRMPYAEIETADRQVGALPAAEATARHTGEGNAEINMEEASLLSATSVAGIAGLPPEPPNADTPTSAIGRYVHLVLQQLYLLSHSQNTMMFENRISWPGGGGTIQELGAMSVQDLNLIRFALMTKRGLTKLPDILDITLGEVYEIKPRAQAREGLVQLERNYLKPLADVGLTRYRAGTSWIVPPVIPVPPRHLAFLSQIPGLIVYDLVSPPPAPTGGGELNWKWLAVTALAVAFVATALSPVPGDEVAVGAALVEALAH